MIEINSGSHGNSKSLIKTLRMRRNPVLRFTSERLVLLRSTDLPFKVTDSRVRVNHAAKLVHPQEPATFFSVHTMV